MDTRLQEGIIGFLLFVVGKENQTANFICKPFFYERFLDWHNTRFNGLTHIFFRLVGRLLLTCKNIMAHVKLLEHTSSSSILKFLVKIWSGLKGIIVNGHKTSGRNHWIFIVCGWKREPDS